MSDVIKNLEKLADQYRTGLYKLNDQIRDMKDVPIAKSLVGKFFKYKYSYSATETWWVYKRVTEHDGTTLLIDCFSEEHKKKIEFEFGRFGYVSEFFQSTEISSKEYFAAQKKLLNKLLRKYKKGTSK